jgi:hypothetical protein
MPYRSFVLGDGTEVIFEVDQAPVRPGPKPAGRLDEAAATVAASFERSVENVQKTAATLVSKLREGMPEEPDELAVEFGIKASGEINGFIIAKAGAEASFKVSLKWKKDRSKPLRAG